MIHFKVIISLPFASPSISNSILIFRRWFSSFYCRRVEGVPVQQGKPFVQRNTLSFQALRLFRR